MLRNRNAKSKDMALRLNGQGLDPPILGGMGWPTTHFSQYTIDRTKVRLCHENAVRQTLSSDPPRNGLVSVALTTITSRLELLQNDIGWIILGASRWIKVLNLSKEANLLLLNTLIDLVMAKFLAKVIKVHQTSISNIRICSASNLTTSCMRAAPGYSTRTGCWFAFSSRNHFNSGLGHPPWLYSIPIVGTIHERNLGHETK